MAHGPVSSIAQGHDFLKSVSKSVIVKCPGQLQPLRVSAILAFVKRNKFLSFTGPLAAGACMIQKAANGGDSTVGLVEITKWSLNLSMGLRLKYLEEDDDDDDGCVYNCMCR